MGKGNYLGEFEQIVFLALVRLREKAYGMPIRQEIEKRTGRNVSIGAVYTTLERLEKKGYVSSRLGEATPERGGRAKKFFDIKAPGLKAFNESRKMVAKMVEGLEPIGSVA